MNELLITAMQFGAVAIIGAASTYYEKEAHKMANNRSVQQLQKVDPILQKGFLKITKEDVDFIKSIGRKLKLIQSEQRLFRALNFTSIIVLVFFGVILTMNHANPIISIEIIYRALSGSVYIIVITFIVAIIIRLINNKTNKIL